MDASQMVRAPSRSQYGLTKRLRDVMEKVVADSVAANTIIMPIGPDMLHLYILLSRGTGCLFSPASSLDHVIFCPAGKALVVIREHGSSLVQSRRLGWKLLAILASPRP